jgi:penicillin-binding protein 1A
MFIQRNDILICCLLIIGLCIGLIMGLCWQLSFDLAHFSTLYQDKYSQVLDDEGNQLCTFSMRQHIPVTFDQVPPVVWQAFVAVEDRNFFEHAGFSWRGIIRSVWANIKQFKKAQGASTITQQLVRLLFLHNKKTYWRKCVELCYTIIIELFFSKEQILEAYLNNTYFGGGMYGIAAAAEGCWGVTVDQLDYEQAALLAGVIRSPSYYCPLYKLEHAQKRKNIVLQAMMDCHFITQEQCDKAIGRSVDLFPSLQDAHILYIKNMIHSACARYQIKDLHRGGYTIQTTFNKKMQMQAEQIFVKHVDRLKKDLSMPIDGGLLTIAVETGKIKALIGGYSFTLSQLNRSYMAKKQMGSTIKPFIYAAAIQNGLSFDQIELDEPYTVSFQGTVWSPRNYNKKHLGFMSRAYALAHSNNIVAVKTLLSTGIPSVVSIIEAAGLSCNVSAYPSLALGCIDVTLKQVVKAFNVFANGGLLVEPYCIEWIKDAQGKKIWRHNKEKPVRLFSLSIASQVNAVLQYACHKVYKQKMATETIGKTGTTNDARTCWFVGSSPSYTTGIYIGCDDNRSMGPHIFPAHTALPIWGELYALFSHGKSIFYYDRALQKAYINKWTGKKTSSVDDDVIMILK